MFEQSILHDPNSARKPYSMVVSLVVQILVIGALCLLPFVFTQALPSLHLKQVLAAPPKPSQALKVKPAANSLSSVAPRPFHSSDLLFQFKRPAAVANRNSQTVDAPPAIVAGEVGGDTAGVPFASDVSAAAPPPPAPVKAAAQRQQRPIRVASISAANLVRMVQPVYPAVARAGRIQGAVEFTATIGRQGAIENLQLVRGHPMLVKSATEAVLQWRYRPTLLNGEPVEVITDIIVNFTLGQ